MTENCEIAFFMTPAFIIIIGTYCIFLVLLLIGWRKALDSPASGEPGEVALTVVVPARDEAANIITLLASIQKQTFSNFEVIVVDDHSTDGTGAAVSEFARRVSWLKLITLQEMRGKKQAITAGVGASSCCVVVTTDADCIVPPEWLHRVALAFNNPHVRMAFGAVRMDGNTLFHRLQAMEFSPLILTGAATLAWGVPTMCNGANLAFRKDVFQEVQGYEGNLHLASGDDEFLMRKVHGRYPDGVSFLADSAAVVSTRPQPTMRALLLQRLRWAAKWHAHSGAGSMTVALYTVLVHVTWLAAPLLVLAGVIEPSVYVAAGVLKITGELVLLMTAMRFLKMRWHWGSFVLLQVFYSLYVLVVGIGANLLTVKWKGRRVKDN